MSDDPRPGPSSTPSTGAGEGPVRASGVDAGADSAPARRSRKQVLLRLDPDVHGAVAKWAADDLRSVNAQIEVLLRRALKEAGRDPHAAPMRGRGRPRSDDSESR